MSAVACQQACIHIAYKRGLASYDELKDLIGRLREAKVATVSELRRWLAGTRTQNRRLADRLLLLLPPPGAEKLGRLELWFHLADGGTGRAWLGCMPWERTGPDGRPQVQEALVAVKEMLPETVATAQGKARFEREIALTQAIQDPAVVRCLGHGISAEGKPYLVLAYVDGGDLRTLIARAGRLNERDTLLIAHQTARGLAAVHRAGVIHRDLKPHNIFLTRRGHARLADFGAARIRDAEGAALTLPGQVHGSPLYMAPEQAAQSGDLDGRADVYGLGCVLFHALVGHPPYPGDSAATVIQAHRQQAIPPLPGIAADLAALVQRCLAKEPGGRPASERLAGEVERLLLARGIPVVTPLSEATIGLSFAAVDEGTGNAVAPSAAAGAAAEPARGVYAGARAGTALRAPAGTPAPVRAPAPPPPAAEEGDEDLTLAPSAAHRPAVGGDWSQAIVADHLTLRGPGDLLVALYARRSLAFGRLLQPPSDCCLRLYPGDAHDTDNRKVGREHLLLDWDAASRAARITDRKSANGTILDGRTLNPEQPWPLQAGTAHRLQVAGVINLMVRVLPQRSRQETSLPGAPVGGGQPCGIDSDASDDAVVVNRQGNRPGLAYALVLRRITLGGGSADLPLPGARPAGHIEIARYAGRWIWRDGDGPAWQPVVAGKGFMAAGVQLVPGAGKAGELE